MHLKEIIFATALLTSGGCKPDEKTEIQQPHHEGYNTSFKIPDEIGALEEESRRRLEKALACQGSILYEVQSGAFRESDVAVDGDVVFLKDDPQCVIDKISSCVIVCLQYQERTMVNGFTIGGVCVTSGHENIAQSQPNLSKKIDLSKIVKERTVFFDENYI